MNILPIATPALCLMIVYATYYGLMEASGRTGLPPPGRRWQVPSHWVGNVPKRRRILVWGTLLGSGFATRNPYAGFGLLPLAAASAGRVLPGVLLGIAIGACHGTSRFLALLRDVHSIKSVDYLESISKSMYWRVADGVSLLIIAGATVSILAFRL